MYMGEGLIVVYDSADAGGFLYSTIQKQKRLYKKAYGLWNVDLWTLNTGQSLGFKNNLVNLSQLILQIGKLRLSLRVRPS